MEAWKSRLQSVLESWQGTPWMAGQECRGRGVDCTHFVVAVLDELHRVNLPEIPRLPALIGLHDREGAMRVARAIENRYPHTLIGTDAALIESGDVVIFRLGRMGGPGHVAIAGANPVELWHAAMGVGVVRSSAKVSGEIVRIWRPAEREKW